MVYTSFVHSMPNKKSYESKFRKPRKFILFPDSKSKKFPEDLYICFESKSGINFQITIDFPEDTSSPDKSPDGKRINRSITCFDDDAHAADKVLARYDVEVPVLNNIVMENKRNVFDWPEIKSRQFQIRKSIITKRTRQ